MNDYIAFCKYVIPIISGCAGFIRTSGYMIHVPGYIVMMSNDETFLNIIKIPIVFNIVLSAKISDIIKLKEENDMLNLMQASYYLGSNIKFSSMMKYLEMYSNIDNYSSCIYSEDDCFNIPGFDVRASSIDIGYIDISNGIRNFKVPASKSITNLNKADKVGLKVYNYINDQSNEKIKTIRYSMYKNKFKLISDIFANIIIL